jgi:hypothetical protein
MKDGNFYHPHITFSRHLHFPSRSISYDGLPAVITKITFAGPELLGNPVDG